MPPQRFLFSLGKRRFNTDVVKVGPLRSGVGLMFRSKETNNLLFSFRKPCKVAITSWFVFFPFVAVWLDSRRRVLESKLVLPFTFSVVPKRNSHYLIELPLNRRNSAITRFLVEK